MDNRITKEQVIEFMAIMDKLKIEFNPNLSTAEKEFLKQMIDQIKNLPY